MPATLNWPRQSISGGCQSSEMTAPLNSLSSRLQIRFCLSTVSNIMIILSSGAVGYNVLICIDAMDIS